jgi:hypothetical protein
LQIAFAQHKEKKTKAAEREFYQPCLKHNPFLKLKFFPLNFSSIWANSLILILFRPDGMVLCHKSSNAPSFDTLHVLTLILLPVEGRKLMSGISVFLLLYTISSTQELVKTINYSGKKFRNSYHGKRDRL